MANFETLCVHPLGKEKEFADSVTSPIFPSVAYNYLDSDELQYPGFYSNYNQKRLGRIIAELENGVWGMVFSSGMAAISTAILSFVQHNDHIIFSRDLYGGTWKFAEQELVKRNIKFSYAENTLDSFQSVLTDRTRLIYIETPANPLLNIVPLKQIAGLAKKHGIITVVDNTFASPINQQPILHGIDMVVHSGTKYLGGHNDLPFGALVSNHQQHKEQILSTAKMYGGSLAPYQCYLVEHSLKTLAIRIQQQNKNALAIAGYLAQHSAINRVYYPGLASHPEHVLASEQMKGFGGVLSFELDASPEDIIVFLKSLSVIQPALSLGGVESLICSPAATSHKGLTGTQRSHLGIRDNLLRLSVGIEHANDLITDLQQAISKALGK
ncbi:PLP-dependent transferase [Pedobacter sp. BS3]|uniref:trans-sulfuration enzyme family protein n=1 Tax=Pedobacter sp. BS3 TaxID=2567937 RepID=UPI0011EC687F|nr:PLP-dependent aspartate aminotransferase family protein [Pedobacter sp. BS3]TZF84774.1 PLP-dependent transferase [Pedobacter sp. BS3]